jgi:hypothetical protein
MGPIAEKDLAGNKLPDGCNWRLCGGAQFEDNQDHVYTWEPGTEVPIEVFSLNVCRCSRLVARRRLSSEPPDPLPPRLISGTAVSQSERPRLNCRLSERADHQSHSSCSVSVVDTATNTVIGSALKEWTDGCVLCQPV